MSNIEHPEHYNTGAIECIDGIKAQLSDNEYIGFLRGNIAKYMWRCDHKGGIEDLHKAQWYLNKLIEFCMAKQINDISEQHHGRIIVKRGDFK